MQHVNRNPSDGHLDEEQLVLYYYGEPVIRVSEHLAMCETCRSEYQVLQNVLNSVDSLPVPERLSDYEATVWRRLAPRLKFRGKPKWGWLAGWGWPVRQWAGASAMVALVIAAYWAGRGSQNRSVEPEMRPSGEARAAVLRLALSDHLERSSMILSELANAELGAGASRRLDISFEQRAAQDLVESNRLYRQTAMSAGDSQTADLLEDLERVLLEIAHSAAALTNQDLEELNRQIDVREILFKVKVFESASQSGQSPPSETL
jgi:hypothetical protein